MAPDTIDPKIALQQLIQNSNLSASEKDAMLVPLSQLPNRPSTSPFLGTLTLPETRARRRFIKGLERDPSMVVKLLSTSISCRGMWLVQYSVQQMLQISNAPIIAQKGIPRQKLLPSCPQPSRTKTKTTGTW